MVSFVVLCWSPFLVGAAFVWAHWSAMSGWPPSHEVRVAAVYAVNGSLMFFVPLLTSFVFARLALDLWRANEDQAD